MFADLGHINLSPAIRHPYKKPKGGEPTAAQSTYNKVIRGVHGVAERANALLEETFAALRRVSLSPTRTGTAYRFSTPAGRNGYGSHRRRRLSRKSLALLMI
jgi:DDE superfamily endonuclease